MKKRSVAGICIVLLTVTGALQVIAVDWYEQTEKKSVPTEGVRRIEFENIDFTEFEYQGDEHATELTMTITYRVHAKYRETADDVFREFDLDIDHEGDVLNVRFNHPRQPESNVFSVLFRRGWKKWKAKMTVTGPITADMDIDSDFSKVIVRNTVGDMKLSMDFSDTRLWDHAGMLDADVEFGSLIVEDLAGGFEINCEFGDTELNMTELTRNSELSVEFGSGTLHLPPDTGASFVSSQSFGDVDYHFSNPVRLDGKQRRVTLNDGGVNIRLGIEFGDIDVTDRGSDEVSARR